MFTPVNTCVPTRTLSTGTLYCLCPTHSTPTPFPKGTHTQTSVRILLLNFI